jgi:hypothetical protein
MTDTRAAFEAWAFDLGICVDEWPSLLLAWKAAINHERSECAKVCEEFGASYDNEWNRKLGVANDLKDACDECAAAIRARSQP